MTRYMLATLAVALGLALAWAGFQTARLATVQAKVAGLQSALSVARAERDAALVGLAEQSRFIREQRARDRAARPVLDAITTGEFDNADDPLDPDMQRLLDCLRTGSVKCGLVPD